VFVRKVRTASGAVAVQVMRKSGRRDVVVEHVGSAHTDAELGVLLERARRIATGDQDVLDFEVSARVQCVGDVADWRTGTLTLSAPAATMASDTRQHSPTGARLRLRRFITTHERVPSRNHDSRTLQDNIRDWIRCRTYPAEPAPGMSKITLFSSPEPENHLMPAPSDLVGRQAELAQLTHMLTEGSDDPRHQKFDPTDWLPTNPRPNQRRSRLTSSAAVTPAAASASRNPCEGASHTFAATASTITAVPAGAPPIHRCCHRLPHSHPAPHPQQAGRLPGRTQQQPVCGGGDGQPVPALRDETQSTLTFCSSVTSGSLQTS